MQGIEPGVSGYCGTTWLAAMHGHESMGRIISHIRCEAFGQVAFVDMQILSLVRSYQYENQFCRAQYGCTNATGIDFDLRWVSTLSV